ncbi:N-chimaerin-like isoform X2 [Liolophura sinensis]|uniref:N-chimaerin-like isoform X2 n=1 Tax=Liolophura sinensis TaxID=3198878 RepID=UPI0031594D9E
MWRTRQTKAMIMTIWDMITRRLMRMLPSPTPYRPGTCTCTTYRWSPQNPNRYFALKRYHGNLSRDQVEDLLSKAGDGSFLVRDSEHGDGEYRLAIRFDETVRHFKLFYDGQHYVGEKRFNSLTDLVQDGLITFYIEAKAGCYLDDMANETAYANSPFGKLTTPQEGQFKELLMRTVRKTKNMMALLGAVSCKDATDSSWMDDCSSEVYEKPHRFKTNTFKGLHWCDLCANFLWGIVQQGVKCQDCGFKAHVKCAFIVPNNCLPSMKYVKKVFGVDLTTVCKAQKNTVPTIVQKCIEEIDAKGLNEMGIYRVAGESSDVEAIRKAHDRDRKSGEVPKFKSSGDHIHTVASVLKLFFRMLPIPLITFHVYPKLLASTTPKTLSGSRRVQLMREALKELPAAHYQTLKYLIAHLSRVEQRKEVNKMSPENLAIVFAPTIMRAKDVDGDPYSAFRNLEAEHRAVTYLIVYQSKIFCAS